jgi:hypothetical protein
MAMITNIRHFMDGDEVVDDLPTEAKELLFFLAAIIEAAAEAYDQPMTVSTAGCRGVVDGYVCFGDLEVWVSAENNQIGWECIECGKEGVISNWEGTPWDKRNYTRH